MAREDLANGEDDEAQVLNEGKKKKKNKNKNKKGGLKA